MICWRAVLVMRTLLKKEKWRTLTSLAIWFWPCELADLAACGVDDDDDGCVLGEPGTRGWLGMQSVVLAQFTLWLPRQGGTYRTYRKPAQLSLCQLHI
jgi:hypothetical protein